MARCLLGLVVLDMYTSTILSGSNRQQTPCDCALILMDHVPTLA